MTVFFVQGGHPLRGEIDISGSKNAVLPLMSSCLLTSAPLILHGVPRLQDVDTMVSLLQFLGVVVEWVGPNNLYLCARDLTSSTVPIDLVQAMRASILVVGPLLARLGEVQFFLPGGCAIGRRPIDLHLAALQRMGAHFSFADKGIDGQCAHLSGNVILFDTVTVTGTENALMAAVLAQGKTIIKNAALEPEVVELSNLLISMGALIQGAGTSEIEIEGVASLSGAEYQVMPDRIEVGTYLCAALASRGEVLLKNIDINDLGVVADKLLETGVTLLGDGQHILLKSPSHRCRSVSLETAPHPGFPTDMQPLFVAMNCFLEGDAVVTETVFENRFMHVPELHKMGCKIGVSGNALHISGGGYFYPSILYATDLRASAALLLAACCVDGETELRQMEFIDRGYERVEEKFAAIGAQIKRQ